MDTLILFLGFMINTILGGGVKYIIEVLFTLLCWVVGLEVRQISSESNTGQANNIMEYIRGSNIFCTSKIDIDGKLMPTGMVFCINLFTLKGQNFFSLIEVKDSRGLHESKSLKFNIIIVGTPSTLESIWKRENKESKLTPTKKLKLDEYGRKEFTVYQRLGGFFNIYYLPNKQLRKLNHIEQQQETADQIQEMLERSMRNGFAKNLRILITGPKGTGKSEMAYVLADRMNACICMDFMPTDPGDNIQNLINHIYPSNDKPLVILINEWDEVIEKICNNMIETNKHIPSSIFSKNSHNNFMDKLGSFENVITILTSNRDKEWFDGMDESFVREGRIDLILKFNEDNVAQKMHEKRFKE